MSLTAAMQALVASHMEDLRVCIPGKVQAYDHAKQTATVVPLVRRRYKAEDGSVKTRTPSPILDVPVAFPGNGEVGITFALHPGDTVLLWFADTSLDEWKASGGTVSPVDGRTHSMTDAIAYPIARNAGRALSGLPSGAMRIGRSNAAHIDITSTQIQAGGTASLATLSELNQLRAIVNGHIAGHPGPGSSAPGPAPNDYTGTTTLRGG